MRILVATHNYPRFAGDPAGGYVRQLALGFARRGHEVQVVAPHVDGTAEQETEAGVVVRRFRYAPRGMERIGYRGEARLSRLLAAPAVAFLPLYFAAFRSALGRAVRKFQPTIIHAHWWLPAGRLVSRLGVPFVVTSHGSDVRILEKSGLLRSSARGVARRARRWTAASQFLARDLERQLVFATGHVTVTPMPVDLAQFALGAGQSRPQPPRVLFAGNLLRSKGVDLLIEAMALLRDRGTVCEARILGEGPELAALQAQVRRLTLGSHVSIHPFVPQSAMPAEYGAATVTVLPTRGQAEGLGLTLVEALAAGSAVIGTAAGGIPEVVQHEVTGLVIPDGDAAAFADAIARLIADPALRSRLVHAGQVHIRQLYSLDATVDRFLDLFDAAVRDRPVH